MRVRGLMDWIGRPVTPLLSFHRLVRPGLLAGAILLAWTLQASGDDVLVVDFSHQMGPAGDPVASGILGGWRDDVPDSSFYPLKPTASRGYLTTPEFWDRADSTGAIVIMGSPSFALWNDCGDSTELMESWKNTVRTWVQFSDSMNALHGGRIKIQHDIWNEPDIKGFWHPNPCWDPVDLFFDAWDAAVHTIRAMDSTAVITGPSFSGSVWGSRWYSSGIQMENFLDHCISAGTMPNILGWHDLDGRYSEPEDPDYIEPVSAEIDSARNLYAQIIQARDSIEARLGDPDAVQYEVNEYLGGIPGLTPGSLVREFALAEKARWDSLGLILAARSYWCDPCQANYELCLDPTTGVQSQQNGRLAGLINPGFYCPGSDRYARRYAWWTYKWYGELTGQFVRCDPEGKLDALASYDADDPEGPVGRVMIGKFQTATEGGLSLRLTNLDQEMVVNEAVHVAVTRIYGDSASIYVASHGLEPDSPDGLSKNYVVEGDSVIVNVDSGDFKPGDALNIILTKITPDTTIAPG